MGVDVHEAGRDDGAGGVDLLRALAGNAADLGNAAAADADVCVAARRAGAVDDGAPTDHEVMAHGCSPCLVLNLC